MITTATTLVLGAGASQPYGFPVGEELRRRMLTVHSPIDRFVFGDDESGRQRAIEFRKAFHRSRATIDEFLEHNADWRDVGIGLIAAHIVRQETEESLYPNEGDWMTRLFRWMADGADANSFLSNAVSVITFNYDRSFEFALQTFLEGRFKLTPESARGLVRTFRILHIHGHVGQIAAENPTDISAYSDDLERRWPTARQIRVIHDAVDDAIIRQAIGILESSRRVFCLGFGYHRVNVERLFSHLTGRDIAIYGTCKGLTPAEQRAAWKLFPQRKNILPETAPTGRIHFAEPSLDCEMLLRHHADIIPT